MNRVFRVVLLVCLLGYAGSDGFGQTVKVKLRVDDIADILLTIKQDMVYDVLNVESKEEAVRSCEKVLKRQNANSGTIEVPEKYILTWIQRNSYAFDEYKRVKKQRNRLMRVAEQLYEQDAGLEILRRSNDSGYSDLRRMRKVLIRELKDDGGFEDDPVEYSDDELDDNGEVKVKRP